MRIILAVLLTAAACSAQSTTNSPPGGEYGNLNNPQRDPWQKPALVIGALNFSTTETVVVIENGYPYFAPRLAPLVKKVYAVSTDARAFQGPGKLPPAITQIVSSSTNPGIAGLGVDTIMLVDMLHQVQQRPLYYLKLLLGLKRGGRVVIIDRILPSVFPSSEQITSTELEGELGSAGLLFQQQVPGLPYQYFLVFKL